MSPELREIMLGQIDAEAARDKAGAEYVINFIEANEPELRAILIEDGTPEDAVPERLYNAIKTSIQFLTTESTRHVGVTIYHRRSSEAECSDQLMPEIKLGWARLLPLDLGGAQDETDQVLPHVLRLTEEGREFIDGYRTVQGLVSLEEQARINRRGIH